jgi:hopene-associated glycosyltransferase HpnB
MMADYIGVMSLAVWIYLVCARGGFWRLKADDLPATPTATQSMRIAVIVPARNEAVTIASIIRSLLHQDYSGEMQIFLVDDHSSDGTAENARQAAVETKRGQLLTVIAANPLPPGWTGKLWALSEGIAAAKEFAPDYYWFTDADVIHEPDVLQSLLARAEPYGFDLVSLMVKLRSKSFAERMLIPAFVFFFFKLYPPEWIASPRKRTAAAAGGCILVRAATLARIGGIAAIKNQLIDDCALAREVKRSGGSIWLGVTEQSRSVRAYESFSELGRMIARTAFTQLHHSTLLLCAAVLAMLITYVAPVALLADRNSSRWLGLAAWTLMIVAYLPTLRLYRLSPFWALLLPLTALFYIGATIGSALQYWKGRGGAWKGRVQDLAQS